MTTLDSKVELISEGGNLLENLKLIVPGSWQTSAQVWVDWQNGAEVIGVSTNNIAAYGASALDLLEGENNPFNNPDLCEALYKGILSTEFFQPKGKLLESILASIKDGKSITIKYDGLTNIKTEGCNPSYCYIEAGSNNTAEEKKAFKAGYGTENPGAGRRFYMLRPTVAQKAVKQDENGLVARACYLYNGQNFLAYDRYFDFTGCRVRGVRLVKAAEGGGAQKADPYKTAYDTLNGHTDRLDDAQVLGMYEQLAPRVMQLARMKVQQ